MKILTLTFITVIIFSSCSDSADLGDSYYYLDSFEAKDVGYPDGAIIYKSAEKLVFDTTIISKKVVYATHNDKFIFAKQLADKTNTDTSYYIIDKERSKVYGPINIDSCVILKSGLKTGL